MGFTLYDWVLSGNCYKVRLLAALLGVDYRTVAVDFHPGAAHREPEILALNPAGTLPVLITDDPEPQILTQTQAMLGWIALRFDASGQWWPRQDPQALAQALEWLAFADGLTATAGAARLHAILDRPCDLPAACAGAQAAFRRLEAHLTVQSFHGRAWLVGNRPTVADIACFPYVALAPDAGLELDDYPAIRTWLHTLRGLPGFITMPGIHARHDRPDNTPTT